MRGVTGLVATLGIVLALAPAARAQRATTQSVTGVAMDTSGAVLRTRTSC